MTEMADRDELERLVQGLDFPISKRALVETLRQRGVAAPLIDTVEGLSDEVYASHAALMSDLERVLRSGL